jgi:plastocyanin
MKTTLAFAVLAWTASTAVAHGDAHTAKTPAYDASRVEERAFGREGDPKRVTRTVKLDMTDAFRFMPADVTVKRGETVKFVVANSG